MNLHWAWPRSLRNVVVISSLAATLQGSGNELLTPQLHGFVPRSDNESGRDRAITVAINQRLQLAGINADGAVSISSTHGVVALSGKRPSPPVRLLIIAVARSVDDVSGVQDQLNPVPDEAPLNQSDQLLARTRQYLTDSWITAQVKAQLLASNIHERVSLSVQTGQGVVTLHGVLADPVAVSHAKEIAACVAGVNKVDVFVQVRPSDTLN